MAIFAPSSAGKTHLAQLILKHHLHLTDNSAKKVVILYCYNTVAPASLEKSTSIPVKFYSGIPDLDTVLAYKAKHKIELLILALDDLMVRFQELSKREQERYVSLFVEHSGKEQICILMTLQDPFPQSPPIRVMVKNATHLVIFSFPSDMLGLSRFLAKLFAGQSKLALECLKHSNGLNDTYCGFLFIVTHPQFKKSHIKVRNFVAPLPMAEPDDQATLFPYDSLYTYPYF